MRMTRAALCATLGLTCVGALTVWAQSGTHQHSMVTPDQGIGRIVGAGMPFAIHDGTGSKESPRASP